MIRSLAALWLCLLLPGFANAALPDEEVRQTFEEANEAYRTADARADYMRAALRYERLIRDGEIPSGALYFNLANSLLGAGDYGRAILNYRRALLFLPDDPAITRNLAIARQRRAATTGSASLAQRNSAQGLPPGLLLAAFVASWVVFWSVLAVRLSRPVKTATLAMLGGLSLVLLALGVGSANDFWREYGVLTVQGVARQGDGLSYQPALPGPLAAGEEFQVMESVDEWSRVELSTGEEVWLARGDYEPVNGR